MPKEITFEEMYEWLESKESENPAIVRELMKCIGYTSFPDIIYSDFDTLDSDLYKK
jgi:hypothetical protein